MSLYDQNYAYLKNTQSTLTPRCTNFDKILTNKCGHVIGSLNATVTKVTKLISFFRSVSTISTQKLGYDPTTLSQKKKKKKIGRMYYSEARSSVLR